MNLEELALEHQETKDRSIRNEDNIKKLEKTQDILYDLVKSVAAMAEQIQNLSGSVQNLGDKVDHLEKKPGKMWETIVNNAIWAFVGVVLAYIFKQLGF